MYPERPNHIGVEVGICRKNGEITLDAPLENADALVLRRSGGDVPVKLSGAAGENLRCAAARRGDSLVRLVSEAQMRAARESFSGENRRTDVTLAATLRVGLPARLTASDGVFTAEAAGPLLERATGRPFDEARAVAQLQKTGGTPYRAVEVSVDADPDAFAPASVLNALRRDALDALNDCRMSVNRRERSLEMPVIQGGSGADPLLLAQSGDPETLKKALMDGADMAVYAPDDLRALDISPLPERFALAVPGVLTGTAMEALNAWALENADRIEATFLSNVGHLGLRWPGKIVGDYLLNVGNDLAVDQLNRWGVQAVTPSVELTAAQIAKLHGPTNLILWGRLPLMHLRHCPLRAARGMKGPHATCRHCDVCAPGERLAGRTLTDRKGAAFPLRRVAMQGGCVIQVLNSVPLMPLKHVDRLPRTSAWRLLLGEEDPAEAVVRVYRAALDGADFRALPEWNIIEGLNTTTGHFFRGVE